MADARNARIRALYPELNKKEPTKPAPVDLRKQVCPEGDGKLHFPVFNLNIGEHGAVVCNYCGIYMEPRTVLEDFNG